MAIVLLILTQPFLGEIVSHYSGFYSLLVFSSSTFPESEMQRPANIFERLYLILFARVHDMCMCGSAKHGSVWRSESSFVESLLFLHISWGLELKLRVAVLQVRCLYLLSHLMGS